MLAYYGHHKCASTWVWQIVGQVCREAGRPARVVLDPLTPEGRGPLTDYRATFPRQDLGGYLREQGVEMALCITADRAHAEALRPTRGFHVIRDPRDLLVSAYFSHRNSHPTDGLDHLAAHRERLRALPKEEGLLAELDFSASALADITDWDYADPDVLELRMEDLTTRPYEGFLEVFRFLDLVDEHEPYRMVERTSVFVRRALNRVSTRAPWLDPLRRERRVTGEELLGAVYMNRFEARARGRARGQEDAGSHYRKGVAGDWANHFTPALTEAFTARYGDLLIRLGYEADHEWTLAVGEAA
jgi:hypothetical protein